MAIACMVQRACVGFVALMQGVESFKDHTMVSLIWYIMGAEDRFLVRVYRDHVKNADDLVAKSVWGDTRPPYCHVGEVKESSKSLHWELSGWRLEPISTTRLAALIPLLVLIAWLGVLFV